MNTTQYLSMLSHIDRAFDTHTHLIITWKNGLCVKSRSVTGIFETDMEPGDENYCGEYAAIVDNIEILSAGTDNSIVIENNSIEISLICIPETIALEDGNVLWQRGELSE